MILYIDESGSITTNNNPRNRFFVISFVETNQEEHVKRVFRNAKKKFLKDAPDCNFNLKDEIKGSEMPKGMKKTIFTDIKNKTDVKFHYMVFDNHSASLKLRQYPAITFNYLIYEKAYALMRKRNVDKLYLHLDNRNCAVSSLNSLEDYLRVKFLIERDMCNDVKAQYHESSNHEVIQLADIFTNTVYRMCKEHKNNGFKAHKSLYDCCAVNDAEFFPRAKCCFDFI